MYMKIYTKAGDTGESSLINSQKMSKTNQVFNVLGTLDELNASLGFCLMSKVPQVSSTISQIQSDLFLLGANFANPKTKSKDFELFDLKTRDLELQIDQLSEQLPTLKNFILPSGSNTSVHLHLSRAICRRLERNIIEYSTNSDLGELLNSVVKYVNRLSDLLFVLARYVNFKLGIKDQIWKNE